MRNLNPKGLVCNRPKPQGMSLHFGLKRVCEIESESARSRGARVRDRDWE